MDIQWTDDVDQALAKAKESGKPLLLDFTAAPM
ncbi:MAG TPA: thioredoxin family protein [Thermoanaerobaculia bacterium]